MNHESDRPSELEGRFPHGSRIVRRIRAATNGADSYWSEHGEHEDVFRTLYLTPRELAVPEHLLSGGLDLDYDIHTDIATLFRSVFDAVRVELRPSLRPGEHLWLAVDASVEYSTLVVFFTDDHVLTSYRARPMAFVWPSEEEMARQMDEWHRQLRGRLQRSRTRGR